VQKQYEQVKLHVTLMNTIFRSDETEAETSRGRHKPRETFDATCILKVCTFEITVIFMLACSDLVVYSRNCLPNDHRHLGLLGLIFEYP
jgi:hypothetical protein